MVQTQSSKFLFEALKKVGRIVGFNVQGTSTGGGSDGNYASKYAPTLDGMGPQGSGAHSEAEFIEVPTLAQRTKAAAIFLAHWPETIDALINEFGELLRKAPQKADPEARDKCRQELIEQIFSGPE